MSAARTLSIIAVALSICVTLTNAQEPPETEITKVVSIAHADARDIAKALSALPLQVSVSAAGPHTLILQGPESEVERLVRDVVGPLEAPQSPFVIMTDVAPVFIPLPGPPNKDFPAMVRAVVGVGPDRRSTIAIDNANRLLVVRGSEVEVNAVRQLVAQLDQPKRSVGIHCYFLRGKMGSAGPDAGKALPQELKPIAASLAKSGLGGASLLAPIIVNTSAGERFRANSALHLRSGGDDESLNFEITGSVGIDSGDSVQLLLRGIVMRVHDENGRTDFEIDTTVATTIGSYVVLAAAPSTTLDGDYIALVARVVEAE